MQYSFKYCNLVIVIIIEQVVSSAAIEVEAVERVTHLFPPTVEDEERLLRMLHTTKLRRREVDVALPEAVGIKVSGAGEEGGNGASHCCCFKLLLPQVGVGAHCLKLRHQSNPHLRNTCRIQACVTIC